MGVRKIRANPMVPHGFLASRKNGCMSPNESNLERDYASLLEFDPAVSMFDAQPLKLTFLDLKGRRQPGWPDFLVHFDEKLLRPPQLIDVKYRSDIAKNWLKLKPRFKAALRHARDNGWTYRIKTDVEIRIPRLAAARFLLTFRHMTPPEADKSAVFEALSARSKTTASQLLLDLSSDKWRRAEMLPTLWHLIGTFKILADLDRPVHMHSEIWVAKAATSG